MEPVAPPTPPRRPNGPSPALDSRKGDGAGLAASPAYNALGCHRVFTHRSFFFRCWCCDHTALAFSPSSASRMPPHSRAETQPRSGFLHPLRLEGISWLPHFNLDSHMVHHRLYLQSVLICVHVHRPLESRSRVGDDSQVRHHSNPVLNPRKAVTDTRVWCAVISAAQKCSRQHIGNRSVEYDEEICLPRNGVPSVDHF